MRLMILPEFFDRFTKLIILNPHVVDPLRRTKIITTDELGIFFRTAVYSSGDTGAIYGASKPSTSPTVVADIGIANLSDATIEDIQHEIRNESIGDDEVISLTRTGGSVVTLISGYRDHHDVIFTGVVAAMAQEQTDSDVITTLKCRDEMHVVKNAVVNLTYGKTPSEVGMTLDKLVEAIANEANIPIGRIDAVSLKMSGPRTYNQLRPIHDIFTEIAAECVENGEDVRYEFKHGALYFLAVANQERTLYDLTPSTGLLSMQPSLNTVYANDSYDIITLLLPEITWMTAVKLNDYICSVTTKPVHISDGQSHITKFTATIAEEAGWEGWGSW